MRREALAALRNALSASALFLAASGMAQPLPPIAARAVQAASALTDPRERGEAFESIEANLRLGGHAIEAGRVAELACDDARRDGNGDLLCGPTSLSGVLNTFTDRLKSIDPCRDPAHFANAANRKDIDACFEAGRAVLPDLRVPTPVLITALKTVAPGPAAVWLIEATGGTPIVGGRPTNEVMAAVLASATRVRPGLGRADAAALKRFLAQPAVLVRGGRRAEAFAAGERLDSSLAISDLLGEFLWANRPAEALALLPRWHARRDPRLERFCAAWLPLHSLLYRGTSRHYRIVPGLRAFLAAYPNAPVSREPCERDPGSRPLEADPTFLLVAGDFDAAETAARRSTDPGEVIDVLIGRGMIHWTSGDHQAAAAAFARAADADHALSKSRRSAETTGDTHRRRQLIAGLAATGQTARAKAVATRLPPPMRAVALSIVAAGAAALPADGAPRPRWPGDSPIF